MIENPQSDSQLPGVHSADVDRATILELVRDLQSCARIESVQARAAVRAEPVNQSDGIESAVQQLLSGAASAVQIRYLYDDIHWTDTIMRVDSGYRMIRMQSQQS